MRPMNKKEVCRVWRYKVEPQVLKLIADCRMLKLCPLLWNGFDWSKPEPESPKWLHGLDRHLKSHFHDCAECPATVWGVDTDESVQKFQRFVNRWSWHWWHSHKLAEEAERMFVEAQPGALYMMYDFQDRIVVLLLCFSE